MNGMDRMHFGNAMGSRMKRLGATWAICTLFAVGAAHAGDAAQGIAWSTDYAGSVARAAAEKKPVLIDFTAEWCGWCKRLDEEVYADASAAKALSGLVCVKIDVDKQPNVALAYNVQSMPRTIVLNVHGEIVGDVTGYQPLGPFLEFLSGLKDDLDRKTGGSARPEVHDSETAIEPEKPPIDVGRLPATELVALLADRDPSVRGEAVRAIGEKPDKDRILTRALGSEWLCARITALDALRKAGAPDLPFDPWATKPERDAALAAWTQWADAHTSDGAAAKSP